MKKHQFILLFVISFSAIVFTLQSCNRSDEEIPSPIQKDIYIAGYEYNNNGIKQAKYWKNGTAVSLSNSQFETNANDIFVVNNDVYVVGNESDGNISKATVWKNGTPTYLAQNNSSAEAIVISNGDVYVAGWEYDTNHSTSIAKYWKNGTAVNLTNGSNNAGAKDIFVNGNDVYVAGYEQETIPNMGTFGRAKYWKNGVSTTLSTGFTQANSKGIFVKGSDVYVLTTEYTSGIGYNVASYYKNGVVTRLNAGNATDNGYGYGIFVDNNNSVYVSGYSIKDSWYGACYWKDGILTKVTQNSSAYLYGIFVQDSDVFLCGYERVSNVDVAKSWKNTTASLLVNSSNNSSANSIFLK